MNDSISFMMGFIRGEVVLIDSDMSWHPVHAGYRVPSFRMRRDNGISLEEWPGESTSSLEDDLDPAPPVALTDTRLLSETFTLLRARLVCTVPGCQTPAMVMIYDAAGSAWPTCGEHWAMARTAPPAEPAVTWILANMRAAHRGDPVGVGGRQIMEILPSRIAPSMRESIHAAYERAADIKLSPAHVRTN